MAVRKWALAALVLTFGLFLLIGAVLAFVVFNDGTAKAQSLNGKASQNGPTSSGKGSGEVDDNLQAKVDNPLFPLIPMTLLVYEGQQEDNGELISTRVEARVLTDTEEVAEVEVRAVLVEDYENEELIERTLDFYAQDKNGAVIYMGELVDDIEDGVVVGHGGQWLAGEGNNLPGIFMPANPRVGDVFEQERAPGIAEDRSEVVATGLSVSVPAGSFSGCIKTRDFDPIGGGTEFKFYCPGVGLVREEADSGHLDLISVGTFDPDELDQKVIQAIGGQNSRFNEEEGEDEDEDNEDDELEFTGIVKSLSNAELVLKDGTAFIINGDTDFDGKIRVGTRVEVKAKRSRGKLIALEVETDYTDSV